MKKIMVGVIALALLLGAFILGRYHLINGPGVPLKLIRKDHFGYSETFINLRRVVGKPYLYCRVIYPKATDALERNKIVWSESRNGAPQPNRQPATE